MPFSSYPYISATTAAKTGGPAGGSTKEILVFGNILVHV